MGGGGKFDQMGGGGGDRIKSRGANWPKVVFLFLVQGEKCGGGGAK